MAEKFINSLIKLITGIIIALVGYALITLAYSLLVKPILLFYAQAGLIQALVAFSIEVVFVGFIIILVYVFKEK